MILLLFILVGCDKEDVKKNNKEEKTSINVSYSPVSSDLIDLSSEGIPQIIELNKRAVIALDSMASVSN